MHTFHTFLTKAILSIMSNFIPNETVTMDDRDSPSMNNKILFLTKNKTEYFKNSVKSNNLVPIRHFEQMQEVLRKIIKIVSKSIIPYFLKNFQLIKSIPNVTRSY